MNAMDCGQASEMIDDYLEHRLGRSDRQRLEAHLSRCSRCLAEVNNQAAIERTLRQGLAGSVDTVYLRPAVLTRILAAVRQNGQHRPWRAHLALAARVSAGVLAVALFVAAMGYSLGRGAAPWVPLLGAGQPVQSLTVDDLVIDPAQLHAGDLFTTTFFVRNDRDTPLPLNQVNLDIKGPERTFHFILGSDELVPARSVAILHITPAWLADATEDQYNVLAGDIIRVPGTYTIRLTLFSPTAAPAR